jgi:hypothetical protein
LGCIAVDKNIHANLADFCGTNWNAHLPQIGDAASRWQDSYGWGTLGRAGCASRDDSFWFIAAGMGALLSFHERRQVLKMLQRALAAGPTPVVSWERNWHSILD